MRYRQSDDGCRRDAILVKTHERETGDNQNELTPDKDRWYNFTAVQFPSVERCEMSCSYFSQLKNASLMVANAKLSFSLYANARY